MKNYIKTGFLILLPSLLLAQGGIRNQGAVIKISSNAQIKIVHGGMLHQNNGTILNDGEIQLTKDWTQQGENSQYLGDGTLTFIGHQNQKISSNSSLTVANMNVNNGHRLVLNNDLQIQHQLDLQHNGSVELGNHNLRIASTATIQNYDKNHYILTNNTGFLQQEVGEQVVLFPVGNATYNPASLSNQGTKDQYQIKVIDQVTELDGAVDRTWQIEETVQGGSLLNLNVQWEEAQELSNFDRNTSAIHQENNTAAMDYSAANFDGMFLSQTGTNLTNLAPFIVTSQAETMLPHARLDDGQPLIGKIQLFPNPAESYLNIRLGERTGTAFIQIFDVKGSLVLQANKAIGNQHIVQLNNIEQLIDGVYSIQITTEDQTTTHKFVKGQL